MGRGTLGEGAEHANPDVGMQEHIERSTGEHSSGLNAMDLEESAKQCSSRLGPVMMQQGPGVLCRSLCQSAPGPDNKDSKHDVRGREVPARLCNDTHSIRIWEMLRQSLIHSHGHAGEGALPVLLMAEAPTNVQQIHVESQSQASA